MGVDVEHDLAAAQARRIVGRTIAVAVRLEPRRVLLRAVLGVLRHRKVPRHRLAARARDPHGVQALLGGRGYHLALHVHRHRRKARALLRPERIEIRRLGNALQLLRLHARAAVEEQLQLRQIGPRELSGFPRLLKVAPLLVHDIRLQSHKSRLVELSLHHERLGERGWHLARLLNAIIAGARPRDEQLVGRHRLGALNAERERHRLARLVFSGALLVGFAVQHRLVELARREHRRREREPRNRQHQSFHFMSPFISCLVDSRRIADPRLRGDARSSRPQDRTCSTTVRLFSAEQSARSSSPF